VAASFLEGVRLTSYDELVPGFGPVKGVGVLDVSETSDAWVGGLRAGDIILAANDESVSNLDELMHRVTGNPKRLLLKVSRGGGIVFLVIDKL
jgi:S1-C subfamily serine protease